MLNVKIKTISIAVTTALLSGCLASSGGGGIAAPATAPAPGTPVTTQPAANTFYSPDAVTVTVPITIAGGAMATVTGPATVLGATTFTATLNPATGNATSATMAGAVDGSVPALTTLVAGTAYTGVATNGQTVNVGNFGTLVPGTASSPAAGLLYSGFGMWEMYPTTAGAATYTTSVWAGGTQFTTTMPTSGSATYSGMTDGLVLVTAAGVSTPYGIAGALALTANFATSAITGNITGTVAIDGNTGMNAGAFNNVALAGTINGNAFSGTATAGALPAGINPAAIAAGTAGTTSGHFYGPTANEVTGVWSMSGGGVQAIGSFGAKQ